MAQEPITTYCPTCGKAFRVPPDLAGKKIACKTCQTQFVVQADKPGIPAAHQAAAPAAPTSHAATAHGAAPPAPPAARAPAPAAPAKTPTAPQSNPPVTAATTAPAPAPHVVDELAPIPFDDSPISMPTDGGAQVSVPSVAKPQVAEKVKLDVKGPYYVIKLVTAGKMIHVNIENALNEYAADGWRLVQVIPIGSDAYAILNRETPPEKPADSAAAESH